MLQLRRGQPAIGSKYRKQRQCRWDETHRPYQIPQHVGSGIAGYHHPCIYTIYWFHVTLGELYKANGREDRRRWLWTLLYIIPFAQFFAYWHQGYQYDQFVNGKYPGIAIFILWIVFGPVVWFLVQRDLNQAAQGNQS